MVLSRGCTWRCAGCCGVTRGGAVVTTLCPEHTAAHLYAAAMSVLLDIHTHKSCPDVQALAIQSLEWPWSRDGHLPAVFSVGIHPWQLHECGPEVFGQLHDVAQLPACAAIGETGLDKHAQAPVHLQQQVLLQHLQLAEALHKPVILHCVKAWAELLQVVRSFHGSLPPMVVHGFRGKPELAHTLLSHGLYLSFGYRYNVQALTACPSQRLFLETDEAPVSIAMVYGAVASARGCSVERLVEDCMANFRYISNGCLIPSSYSK